MIRILVVEDEPGIALGLEEDLTIEGYGVEIARDGETAVRRGREGQFNMAPRVLLQLSQPPAIIDFPFRSRMSYLKSDRSTRSAASCPLSAEM